MASAEFSLFPCAFSVLWHTEVSLLGAVLAMPLSLGPGRELWMAVAGPRLPCETEPGRQQEETWVPEHD